MAHSNLTADSVDLAPQVKIQDARFLLSESWLADETCADGKLKVAKVLGALVEHAPNDEGRLYVANAIRDSPVSSDIMETRKALNELAEQWLQNLMYPIKAAGHKRSQPPTSSLTPTLQDTGQLIEKATRGDQKALVKALHLRENNRCCISGVLSVGAASEDSLEIVSQVQAAHILPFSLNKFDDRSAASVMESAVTWDMLKSWAGADIQRRVGAKINSTENAILLRSDLHGLFRSFKLWLEAQEQQNVYTVKTLYNSEFRDRAVRFSDGSENTTRPIPLPDSTALALHAAFAKVLHASGAAEHFENFWQDDSTHHILAGDGASDISIALSGLKLHRTIVVS